MEKVEHVAYTTATGPAICPVCAKRKRDSEEAEKAHALRMSLFSQERYWINDSEEEMDPTEELPYTESQMWEDDME